MVSSVGMGDGGTMYPSSSSRGGYSTGSNSSRNASSLSDLGDLINDILTVGK